MYRINFFDAQDLIIATHVIVADKFPLETKGIEKYCSVVSDTYPKVCRWMVYGFSGFPLFSGFRS